MAVIQVYDGLFKGGMKLIMFETIAELGYPVGESLTLGMVNAMQYLVRFILNVGMRTLVGVFLTKQEIRERQHQVIWLYGVLMGVFFFSTIYAIILWWKSEFIMHRYIEDAKEDPSYSQFNEDGEPMGELHNGSFDGTERSHEAK